MRDKLKNLRYFLGSPKGAMVYFGTGYGLIAIGYLASVFIWG